MRKKGFTLIELLAVIVVLAIIALIAVPIVINIIEKARIGALKDSAYGIIDAADLHFAQNSLNGSKNELIFEVEEGKSGLYIKGTESKLNFKGEQPEIGSEVVVATNGKVSIKLISGDYCVVKTAEGKELKLYKSDCLNGLDGEVNEAILTAELAKVNMLVGSEALTTSSNNITGAINEINGKIDIYDSEIYTLSNSAISSDSAATSLNGTVSTLSGTVSTLNGKITTLDNKVDTLDTKVITSASISYNETFTGEYWTNGKKIYTKSFNFGTLPNTGTKYLSHGIANVELIWIDGENTSVWAPVGTSFAPSLGAGNPVLNWYSWVSSTEIAYVTGNNRTTYTSIVTVRYTKTTN